MLRWLLPVLALLARPAEFLHHETSLPTACPTHSWCVPSGLCDPRYVIYDPLHAQYLQESYLCGGTSATAHYVCCATQELLPHQFHPTLQHWHYERRGSSTPDDLLVLPWIGHHEQKRHHHSTTAPPPVIEAGDDDVDDDDGEDGVVTVEDEEYVEDTAASIVEEEKEEDAEVERRKEADVVTDGWDHLPVQQGFSPPQICPRRAMCVHWSLCDVESRKHDFSLSDPQFLCGKTLDSESFICCEKLLGLGGQQTIARSIDSAGVREPTPLQGASGAEVQPGETPVPTPPQPTPEQTPSEQSAATAVQSESEPIPNLNSIQVDDEDSKPPPPLFPLDLLVQAFAQFSPPPEPDTSAPESDDQQEHYLDKVLLDRNKREVSAAAQLGQVIFPSRIARERLDAARASSASVSESSRSAGAFGGRLKPAAGGQVKLGGLSIDQVSTVPPVPSSVPDVRRELPIPPPRVTPVVKPEKVSPPSRLEVSAVPSTPFAVPVTPRTVEGAADSDVPDIRPLPVPVWRGDPGPLSRSISLDEEDDEAEEAEDNSQSVLGRILNRLPNLSLRSDARHHRQPQLGQFFPIRPPVQKPGNQPPHKPFRGPRPPFFQRPVKDDDHIHKVDRPEKGFHQAQHAGAPVRPDHQPDLHRPGRHPPVTGSAHRDHSHLKPGSTGFRQDPSARCGVKREIGLHARITTSRGEVGEAGYGAYPWHVGVLAEDLTYLCAGVLVSARQVLTVAHCVASRSPREQLVVRVGDWDLAAADELYPAYDVEVFRVTVHPDYYAGNLQNDIALLVLDPPIEGLPHVLPACLPPPHADLNPHACWVTGWGQARHVAGDRHDPSSYSWRLRETELALVSHQECQHKLRSTQLGSFYQLPRRGALCAAGRGGSDACFGDGGGALVCQLRGAPAGSPLYAAGLVSWGLGCGQDIPAVYTKVSDYTEWIQEHRRQVDDLSLFQYARGQPPRH